MQIKDSKYHKCWEIEDKGTYKKIKIGDSKKKQDGSYENCTWFGILVGKAAQVDINKDDVFTIHSGQVFTNKGNDGKFYTSVTVFELEVTKKAESSQSDSQGDFTEFDPLDDDCPFN